MWYFSFAVKRLQARWQSLLTVIVGVFLAAIVGANASLYTDAIAGVGLLQYLNAESPADTHLYARTSFSAMDVGDVSLVWDNYNAAVTAVRDEFFSVTPWFPQIVDAAETQAMFVLRDGMEVPDTRLRLGFATDIEAHVVVTQGSYPSPQMDLNGAVPVAIHELAAEELDIGVGDQLEIDQRGWETSQRFRVEIVGLIREIEPDDAYWLNPSPLRRQFSRTSGYETALMTTRPALERVVQQYIPQPSLQVNWRLLFPHEQFAVSRLDEISAQVDAFEIALAQQTEIVLKDNGVFIATNLPDVLRAYGGNIDLLNIPTGLILLQLGVLVLFFLIVISALVQRGERREIALLQSRGVYDRQVLLLRGIEALFICLFAALASPYLARVILRVLLPLFTGIGGIPLPLNTTVFAYAFGAALVALFVLVATLRPVLQQPLVLAGGSASRSSTQTWWQRYYVDVVLLVAGMIAFTQFNQDRVLISSADGTVQADPLLLLTPALLFIAFSSILLRFFPMTMSLVANAASRRDDLAGALAAWQVSREPLHYGRITFLLSLAIGIGGFAVTYEATLVSNEQDQARYSVGSDVRVIYELNTPLAVAAALNEQIAQHPDVAALSFNNRIELISTSTGVSSGTSGHGSRSRQGGVLLAVDPDTIGHVSYSRADLGAIMPPLYDGAIPQPGRILPMGTREVVMQVRLDAQIALRFSVYTEALINAPDILTDTLTLQLRLRDEAGTLYLLPLMPDTHALEAHFASLEVDEDGNNFDPPSEEDVAARVWPDDGWITYTAALDDSEKLLPETLYLEGVIVQISTGFTKPYDLAQISLANLQALDVAGNVTSLDWLQPENWSFVNELFAIADEPTDAEIFPEGASAGFALRWTETDDRVAFGLLLDYPELTSVTNSRSQDIPLVQDEIVGIPVFISRSFAEINSLQVGQRFSLFFDQSRPWFEVVDVVDYYPTLYQDSPYLVGSRDIINYTVRRRPQAGALPAETWIHLQPDANSASLTDLLNTAEFAPFVAETAIAQRIVQTSRTDTLSLGIIGLLYLSFMIGMVLSAVSLFTYVSLSVRARLSEFAILRAMGMPQNRLLLVILLEQLLILVTALILGTVIGFFLSTQVLPPLTVSAAGGEITPPYIIRYDVGALVLYMLLVLLVMGIVLMLGAGQVRRSTGVDALRFEGE